MKPVTIYDIAKEANVSVATVSRVLNNSAPVKRATRDRINELIQKYQFQPNALARSLLKKETGMIGIIFPDITNPFFPMLLAGLEEEARSKGYHFFLCDTVSTMGEMEDQYDRESQYISILMEQQVDGIIMLGGRINLSRPAKELVTEVVDMAKRVPLLLINGHLPGADLNRICVDERAGAELATQHLIDLGHKRIMFAGGYRFMSNTAHRMQGFQRTMERNGLALPPDWTLIEGYSIETGKEAFERLGHEGELPTAVFCANDQVAIGMLKAAHKAGLKVPDDLSLVGFDDIPYASNSIPELTTVSLQSYEVGRNAIGLLHRMIGKEKVPKRTTVKPALIVRESTAPPRTYSATGKAFKKSN